MARRFYDLLVSFKLVEERGELVLLRAEQLGFRGIGVGISIERFLENSGRYFSTIKAFRRYAEQRDLDVISRLVVDKPVSVSMLKGLLKKWRRRFELISVHATERSLTAFASRDSRIDLLTLTPKTRIMRGDVDYVKSLEKKLELLLSPLQRGSLSSRAFVVASYRALLSLIRKKNLVNNLIVSSGAGRIEEMRDPRSIASLMQVLGLEYREALNALSSNPLNLVRENREKLKGVIAARGVRILE